MNMKQWRVLLGWCPRRRPGFPGRRPDIPDDKHRHIPRDSFLTEGNCYCERCFSTKPARNFWVFGSTRGYSDIIHFGKSKTLEAAIINFQDLSSHQIIPFGQLFMFSGGAHKLHAWKQNLMLGDSVRAVSWVRINFLDLWILIMLCFKIFVLQWTTLLVWYWFYLTGRYFFF